MVVRSIVSRLILWELQLSNVKRMDGSDPHNYPVTFSVEVAPTKVLLFQRLNP